MKKGTVKFFNDSKGFGFIIEEESKTEYFVHVSGLIAEIREDDNVELENELETEMGGFYNKAFDWKNPNGNKAAQQGLIDDPRIMAMLQRSDWQEAYKLAKKNTMN